MLEGDKPALSFVESKAKAKPKLFRRMLVELYGEHKEYASAERVLNELRSENPKDTLVAENLVRVTSLWAADAAEHGNFELERSLNDKVAGLIREFRVKFPSDLTFLQAECDLAARRGDLKRAADITKEMDRIAKNSPSGPLVRARIFAAQGRTREVAEAYTEALERNPRQLDVRILLGQTNLKLGQTDEALRQAKYVLDIERDQPDALLLQAQALASASGSKERVAAQRTQAIELLGTAVERNPKFLEAYHLKSEMELALGQRGRAIETLKEGLKAVPQDAAGLSLLLQELVEPREKGTGPTPAELAEAKAIAEKAAQGDKKGNMLLAIAVGFHKGGEFELALPWARQAADKLDSPMVHLNYGDLLLTIAEKTDNASEAKELFRQAVEQYDLVLKAQASSVEAVNNKAWILHSYLGQSKQALELAQALLKRVDPATLPGEFFDTLGSIQEANGRLRDAEDSYAKGLSKSPDHPVLNYHMGKLLASDRSRSKKAAPYLEKAQEGKDRLSPAMRLDLNTLMQRVARNS
jgi:tetratricopeptide (TPR) repeat protein